MTDLNVPDELDFEIDADNVRFSFEGLKTNWMALNDSFIKRIARDNLNEDFLAEHLKKEIEIKNTLDEGCGYLKSEKYQKAIAKFDEVLFYDPEYGEALLMKSHSLKGQSHFVKSLRYYKSAVAADDGLEDIDYYKDLIRLANDERDRFPKLKLNIYAGDEQFAKGEFEKAIESYNRALSNPSKFKNQILSRLLNKKATALLKLDDFSQALDCFRQSLNAGMNDYAVFGEGICEHELGLDVADEFKRPLDITKRQMLRQVMVLKDLGLYGESFAVCDYLCQNHFAVDEFYMELHGVRKSLLSKLALKDDFDIVQFDYCDD